MLRYTVADLGSIAFLRAMKIPCEKRLVEGHRPDLSDFKMTFVFRDETNQGDLLQAYWRRAKISELPALDMRRAEEELKTIIFEERRKKIMEMKKGVTQNVD